MLGTTRFSYPTFPALAVVLLMATFVCTFALPVEGRTPLATAPQGVERLERLPGAGVAPQEHERLPGAGVTPQEHERLPGAGVAPQEHERQVKVSDPLGLSLPEKEDQLPEVTSEESFRPRSFKFVEKVVTPVINDKVMRGL